jgi:hypothetical protein
MEVSGGAWEVACILEPHVQRVVVVSPDDTGMAQARTKTDKLDARAPASLLWRGGLEAEWMPDERARVADSSRGHALRGADHRLRQSISIKLDSAGPHLADRVEFSSSALESAGTARDRCVQPRRVACGTQVRCGMCSSRRAGHRSRGVLVTVRGIRVRVPRPSKRGKAPPE